MSEAQNPPARKRRYAASNVARPHVARDVAATAAVCQSAVSACAPADGQAPALTFADALAAVCHELSERTVGPVPTGDAAAVSPVRDLVVDAVSTAAYQAQKARVAVADPANQDAVTAETAKLTWIAEGHLRDDLLAAFDAVVVTGDLDTSNAALILAGIDAERITSAVIAFHSQQHMRLVWHEIKKIRRVFPEWDPHDLMTWGWQGLRLALRKYDPSRDNAFATYACLRINGEIRDGVRKENPIPKRLTTLLRKVSKAEEDLTQAIGRAPSLLEVAEHIGHDAADLKQKLPRLAPAASLDERASNNTERHLEPACLVDTADPAEEALVAVRRDELRSQVETALARLPEADAEAVRLLVMEERKPAEVAAMTGATTRQLRTRQARGLAALREELETWESLEV